MFLSNRELEMFYVESVFLSSVVLRLDPIFVEFKNIVAKTTFFPCWTDDM